MILWNLSIVTVLTWASIKLRRVLWCPKHRKLSHRMFLLNMEILKKQCRFQFSQFDKNLCGCHGNMRADWWNWIFLNENLPEKSYEAGTPNSKPFWRNSVILERGYNVLDRVKMCAHSLVHVLSSCTAWTGWCCNSVDITQVQKRMQLST